MNKNFQTLYNEIDDYFSQPQTSSQRAWGIIHEFYHRILTHMEENSVSKADLAKRLGKSRAAVSQMFSKTPNITILKMVEIADAIGVDIKIEVNYAQKEGKANRLEKSVNSSNLSSEKKRHYSSIRIPQKASHVAETPEGEKQKKRDNAKNKK